MNDLPNASVSATIANALYMSSDHIPLVANYIFEYVKDTTGNIDTTISIVEQKQLQFRLFPNPVNTNLTIQSDGIIDAIQIYAADGKLMFADFTNSKEIQLTTGNLPKGIYVAIMRCGDVNYRRTFVKN